jgi:glycosyltransferase involved in cell wall biosynthesis
VTTPDDREAGQHDCVRFLGYLAHRDSLALIRTADLLFLPMHDVPAGERISIVPGKTYEYLAAGTPILAAVPDGDARDLLAASGQAVLCRPSDAVAMAELIGAAVARWEAGEPRTAASAAFLDGFERRALAADLAKLFARVGKLPLQPEVGARWAWRRADREREPA